VPRQGKVVVLYAEVGERGDVARVVKAFEDSLGAVYPRKTPEPAAPPAPAAAPDSSH
jgi:hypothetical protein